MDAMAADTEKDNTVDVDKEDVEKKESKIVANGMKPLTTDAPQSFTTTNACATPTDGTSQMVTPVQLAASQKKT